MSNFFVEKNEAFVSYDARMVVCSNGYLKAKKYKKSLEKLKDGYEAVQDFPSGCNSSDVLCPPPGRKRADERIDQVIEKRSLTRTRDTLIAYAAENEKIWSSFITLTFRDNITDLTEANKKFNTWRTAITRKFPDFSYLCVPEFQKRGAVHYHMFSNLKCGSDIPAKEPVKTWNKEKKKYYEIFYYDLPFWKEGFSSAEDISTFDDKFNCALYITKYLYKDIDDRLWGRNKIMKSNNLRKPKTYYMNTETFQQAMDYIKKCGYEISAYDFNPVERYVIPHTAYTVKGSLNEVDCNTIKKFLSNTYQD